MMRKYAILAILALAFRLSALDISLADVEIVRLAGDPEEDSRQYEVSEALGRAIGEFDRINCLHIHPMDREIKIRSLLDASTAAYDRRLPYMLYGSLYVDRDWLEIRLSLYEYETDRIITVFYGKSNIDRYDRLVENAAENIGLYFYDRYGIEPAYAFNPHDGYWEIGGSLGYWGILPEWNDTISGTATLDFHCSLALSEPYLRYDDFLIYPKVGLSLGYGAGINKPDYESSLYNSISISLPLEICAEWRDIHCFGLLLGLGDQIDLLVQSRLYGGTYAAVSQAFVLSAGLSYKFMPEGSDWAFGIKQVLDFAYYEEMMYSYKPSITVERRFRSFKGDENE